MTDPKDKAELQQEQPAKKSFTVDDEAARYLKLAENAQRQRRAAPPVDVNTALTIPQKDLIRQFAPECVEEVHYERLGGSKVKRVVDKQATHHPFFGSKDESEKYALQGYEPVLFQGKQVHYEKDRLWRLPMDLHRKNEDLNAKISKARLAEAKESSKGKNPIVSEEVTEVREPGEARHEELLSVVRD